jgi:integrase
MRQKVKVILKKVNKEDLKGYLRISIRENNKTIIKSISLPPIEFKFWNEIKQVVKSTFPEYKYYNEEISKALKELNSDNLGVAFTSKFYFISSCKKLIDDHYEKHSTKKRYKHIINSFEFFIKSIYKKDDIQISNINTSFFEEYVKYKNAQKTNGQNNIKMSISLIKTFLRLLEKSYELNLPPNFYEKIITLKTLPQKKKILSKEDFFKILNTTMNNKKLEETRQIFLYQVFCSGLRFSDVCTLRFKDFTIDYNDGLPEIRFVKFQRKTRKLINTLVSFRAVKLLAYFLPVDSLNDEDKKKMHYYIKSGNLLNKIKGNTLDLDNIKVTLTVDLENVIIKRHFTKNEITVSVNELIPLLENHSNSLIISYKNQGLDDVKIDKLLSNDEHLAYFNNLIDVVKKRVQKKLVETSLNEKKLNMEFYNIIAKILKECKINKSLHFVFPLLDNNKFIDITADDGFSSVNLNQQYSLSYVLETFNFNLSKLCDELGITRISSHYARNSFGTLLLALRGENNIDIHSLREAMGHSSVVQTENYIHSLSNEGKDNLGKFLSDNI